MKIKNTSLKVIGIAGVNILPDQVAEIDEKTAALPAVARYMELGFIKRDEQEQQKELEDRIRREMEAKLRAEAEAAARKKAAEESEKRAKSEKKAKAESAEEK